LTGSISQTASARTTIRRTPRPPAVGLVVVPDGVTVFDDQYPDVANLDPDLLQALP
jgi:hypothetical protein